MSRVVAHVRLIHPFPALTVSATGFGIALVAAPLQWDAALRILAMILASQVAIGSFNEYCDAPVDAIGQPWKPIPAGLLTRRDALVQATAGLVACLAIAASFGAVTAAIAVAGCAIGGLYDSALKRTPWSWLPYVVDVPLLPIWAWSAAGVLTADLIWIYPVGGLLALSAHIANAIPDDAEDRSTGAHTIVQQLGMERALALLRVSFLGAGLLGALTILPSHFSLPLLTIGAGAGAVGLVGVWLMGRADRRRLAFRLIALAAGLLAIGAAVAVR
ncbi:MAG TPA: UbiA family prenyltransferase [Chloroflexota bacterium]|nr:UbiA family prenyltransferase [Chloroflexota bacterium]